MSAVISYQAEDGVLILTDGATYDAGNRVTRIGRKIRTSDKCPLAIASRGNMHVGDLLADKIVPLVERFGFDSAMEQVENAFDQWGEHLDGGHSLRCEMLIAGVSDSGPKHLFFHTVGSDDFPSFDLHNPGKLHIAINGVKDVRLSDMGIPTPQRWETPFDWFSTRGVDIMQWCRELEIRSEHLPGAAHLIGGQIDLTLVTPKGVSVKTIHRWPDKIGEPINPFAGNVVPLVTGNRQQLRAAERDARKRA